MKFILETPGDKFLQQRSCILECCGDLQLSSIFSSPYNKGCGMTDGSGDFMAGNMIQWNMIVARRTRNFYFTVVCLNIDWSFLWHNNPDPFN